MALAAGQKVQAAVLAGPAQQGHQHRPRLLAGVPLQEHPPQEHPLQEHPPQEHPPWAAQAMAPAQAQAAPLAAAVAAAGLGRPQVCQAPPQVGQALAQVALQLVCHRCRLARSPGAPPGLAAAWERAQALRPMRRHLDRLAGPRWAGGRPRLYSYRTATGAGRELKGPRAQQGRLSEALEVH